MKYIHDFYKTGLEKSLARPIVLTVNPLAKTGTFAQVYHVNFPTRYDTALAFVRMQEWYESPKFHHQRFTLEDYMRWYAHKKSKKHIFEYPNDWVGFNVPSTAVREVIMNFPQRSQAETALCGGLSEAGAFKHGRFYVIGTSTEGHKDDPEALEHEKAHGRYFVDIDYRVKVLKLIRKYDTRRLRKFLLADGYGSWVLEDEIHAYALTGWPDDFKPTLALKALRRELKKIA